jgi:hypothetical protein
VSRGGVVVASPNAQAQRCRMIESRLMRRHVRTTKEPVQPIPLFTELIELLMEVSRAARTRTRSATTAPSERSPQ